MNKHTTDSAPELVQLRKNLDYWRTKLSEAQSTIAAIEAQIENAERKVEQSKPAKLTPAQSELLDEIVANNFELWFIKHGKEAALIGRNHSERTNLKVAKALAKTVYLSNRGSTSHGMYYVTAEGRKAATRD